MSKVMGVMKGRSQASLGHSCGTPFHPADKQSQKALSKEYLEMRFFFFCVEEFIVLWRNHPRDMLIVSRGAWGMETGLGGIAAA
jgi:hypothetical protein